MDLTGARSSPSDAVATASAPWLQLDDITLAYGRKVVVSALNLALPRGAIGCLLGPSGCGKTTVLRAIAGFEPLVSGTILLDGDVLSRRDRHVAPEQRRVGMVFQDQALFPHLTVAANVGFGLRGVADAPSRVARMPDPVGLSHRAARSP